MARRTLPDADHVPIGLTVSETDAAQIDEVLTRPEFAGWSRSEWCREIIRTALRYYVGGPAPGGGEARARARPATTQPASPKEEPASPREQRVPPGDRPTRGPSSERPGPVPARQQPAPAPPRQQPAPVSPRERPLPMPAAERPAPMPADDGGAAPDGWDEPENPAQAECSHPADARDYERGVCAACGAVIWD